MPPEDLLWDNTSSLDPTLSSIVSATAVLHLRQTPDPAAALASHEALWVYFKTREQLIYCFILVM